MDKAVARAGNRMRRMLCRALFVGGGAVAGTAIAWGLSPVDASAETARTQPVLGIDVSPAGVTVDLPATPTVPDVTGRSVGDRSVETAGSPHRGSATELPGTGAAVADQTVDAASSAGLLGGAADAVARRPLDLPADLCRGGDGLCGSPSGLDGLGEAVAAVLPPKADPVPTDPAPPDNTAPDNPAPPMAAPVVPAGSPGASETADQAGSHRTAIRAEDRRQAGRTEPSESLVSPPTPRPSPDGPAPLPEGTPDAVGHGGSGHTPLTAFRSWSGGRLAPAIAPRAWRLPWHLITGPGTRPGVTPD